MITAAAVQMKPELTNTEKNLGTVASLATKARESGAELIVFPECCLTGYALTDSEARSLAEPLQGPSTEKLAALCARIDAVIVIGLLESGDDGELYNTAALIDPTGLRAGYRKTHLPTLGVDRFVTPGDKLAPPVDCKSGLAGLLICYDLRFPEPARVLALEGAQMITLPTAWPRAASLYPDHIVRTRAAENYIYVIAANRIGEERGTHYLGRSIIANPDGRILTEASSDDQEILIAQLDPELTLDKHRIFQPGEYELDLLNDRRPDLYSALLD